MFIVDDYVLIEMKKNPDKTKRVHKFKVSYLTRTKGTVEYTFEQSFSPSRDAYHPFFLIVYDNIGVQVASGVAKSAAESITKTVLSILEYRDTYRTERNELLNKVGRVLQILNPNQEEDTYV